MGAGPLSQADVAIVVMANTSNLELWIEDAAVASTYILLAAEQFNVGACWIHIRNRAGQQTTAEEEIRQLLGMPDNFSVLNVIDLGGKAKDEEKASPEIFTEAEKHVTDWKRRAQPPKVLHLTDYFANQLKADIDSLKKYANHLKLEGYSIISYKTIYRAVYAGMFDTPEQRRSQGNRGAHCKFRHSGKPCRPKGYVSNRGKIPISHELKERPVEANERSRLGDWEANTMSAKIANRVC